MVNNNPVWSDEWNPETDTYDPNADTLDVWGVAEPTHGDTPGFAGEPQSEQYGRKDDSSTDVAYNLLTDVKERMRTTTPPIVVHHVMHTSDVGSTLVRARVVVVTNNNIPTVLLEENPGRRRALIKVITTASVVMIQPGHQGGNAPLIAPPVGPSAQFPQATGDPMLEIKSQALVEAYGTVAAGTVMVAVWEELEGPNDDPGLV